MFPVCLRGMVRGSTRTMSDARCRLRDALASRGGRVIVGKTVTTELATFVPSRTCNPQNPITHLGDLRLGRRAVAAGNGRSAGDRDTNRRLDHPARRLLRRGRLQTHLSARAA